MGVKEINRFITDIELFKGLSAEEIEQVAAAVEEREYAVGEYLF